jgi:hypothetical protein
MPLLKDAPDSIQTAFGGQKALTDAMSAVSAGVTNSIQAGIDIGLSHDAVAISALIGVLSHIRIEGRNEDEIIREAKRLCDGTTAVFRNMRST